MDINDLRAGFTVLTFVLFVGIVWWAYSDRRMTKQRGFRSMTTYR